ncbi:BTAD domain-containing putative transcriptional regulator [Nocardioides sp.]|uniref:BTAD domain-containing putative transcriptional regulator n=1 Tax=Nocardioides sp. TaxID=35761 RepID=UPI0037837AE8
MLVRVLGPVRVVDAGVEVPLPGAIPGRILALLTTELETGLRAEVLIDQVWGPTAPAAAGATLQSHVARLRRVIGPTRVVTTTNGYRLALPAAAVDAHQFDSAAGRGAALLAQGRTREAAEALRRALALWPGQGPAYDGVEGSPLVDQERERLGQLRMQTLERRMEVDLATSPSRELVAELEALLASSPTNERLWVLLVRAWRGVGDPAEALATYARARETLRDELGLEPGAELRAAQAEVLRPATARRPPASARRGERRHVTLVAAAVSEREADPEVAQLAHDRLQAVAAEELSRLGGRLVRTPGAVVIGVLGAETAHEDDAARALLCARRIAATGARVGVTSGWALVTGELDRLGPVADRAAALALTAPTGEVSADWAPRPPVEDHGLVPFVGRDREVDRLTAAVRESGRTGRGVVVLVVAEAGIGKTRLVAEARSRTSAARWVSVQCDALGERSGMDPLADALPGLAAATAGTRTEAIAAWSDALAALAADEPVVVCLEDAHWASEVLLDLVDQLAVAPVRAPLVLVVTARPEIEWRRPGWASGPSTVRLGALGPEETSALVGAVLTHAGGSGATVAELAAASGGVPLFAVELGRAISSGAGQRVPTHLGELLAARIDSLEQAARDLLLDASVLGSTFWAEAIGADPAALDALLQREFVVPVEPSTVAQAHEYRFRHDLLRDAAYERLLRPDRARGHLAAARWWAALERATDQAIVAEHAWLAHELFTAAGVTDPAAAEAADVARRASRAAAVAARGLDTAAAVTFLERAVALSVGRPEEAATLVELGEALAEKRALVEADAAVLRARSLVDARDGATRVAAAFLTLQLDFAWGRPQDEALLAGILQDFPDGPEHISTLGVLAVNLVIGQTPEAFTRALQVSDRAIALAERHGDPDLAVLSFATRGRARLALGDRRGLADMQRAQERGPGRLPPFVVLGTRQWFAGAAHHWSGPATELRIREELEDYAWRTGMEFLVSFGAAERLRCLWELGRAEECVAEADRIEHASDAMGRYVVVQRALALGDLGRVDDRTVEEVLATPPADATDLRHVIATAVICARHALDVGDVQQAIEVLTGLGDLGAYAARDGAAELLPRVLRLGGRAGLDDVGRELAEVSFEPTPLGRALGASVRGLVLDDAGLLDEAVIAWAALGAGVDLELARDDARRLRRL